MAALSSEVKSDSQETTFIPPPLPSTYICPICQHTPVGPFITPCNHTFCHQCISLYLQKRSKCPSCNTYMTIEQLRPHYNPEEQNLRLQHTPDIRTTTNLSEPPPVVRREEAMSRRGEDSEDGGRGGGEGVAKSGGGGDGILSRMLGVFRSPALKASPSPTVTDSSKDALAKIAQGMSTNNIKEMIAMLSSTLEKKKDEDDKVGKELLVGFLRRALMVRRQAMMRMQKELDMLVGDIESIGEEAFPEEGVGEERGLMGRVSANSSASMSVPVLPRKRPRVRNSLGVDGLERCDSAISLHTMETAVNSSDRARRDKDKEVDASSQELDKESMSVNSPVAVPYSPTIFEEFQKNYFNMVGTKMGDDRSAALGSFAEDMEKFTRFKTFRCRASLMNGHPPMDSHAQDLFNPYNIVSWIEFDRDSELIAAAGVTKRIKIYEFGNYLRDGATVLYPVKEISAPAKLSCLSWNSFIQNYMVTSDYDGNIILWDAHRGIRILEYDGHDKRTWSVDFSKWNPTLFASGSDDGRVRIWSTNQISSAITIENRGKLSVCSVKFNPGYPDQIAFGSPDHCVHVFDLRHLREPLHVFSDHTKTVSYVNFLSPNELVSTCNDSTIKVWDMRDYKLIRTFTGHTNEKHFVGLSVTNDYIACGSEDNSVYAYYKKVSQPFASYKFGSKDLLTGADTESSAGPHFVSSVCWCPKNPRICLGANSQGLLKVLELE